MSININTGDVHMERIERKQWLVKGTLIVGMK